MSEILKNIMMENKYFFPYSCICFHCESIKIRSFSYRLVAPGADLSNDNFGSQFIFESGNDSVFSEMLLQSSLFCS